MFKYEINIAQNYKGRTIHFARVVLQDGVTEEMARVDFKMFTDRFTASQGFSLTLRKVQVQTSQDIAFSEGA
jgi:hypothetical protein